MHLANEIRPKFIAGVYCPAFSEISLEFLLRSEELGEATELLTIPIKPFKEAATEVVYDDAETS